MLVFARKPQERIVVSGPCVITLIRAGVGKAYLGIDADPDTRIDREEVLLAKSADAVAPSLAELHALCATPHATPAPRDLLTLLCGLPSAN